MRGFLSGWGAKQCSFLLYSTLCTQQDLRTWTITVRNLLCSLLPSRWHARTVLVGKGPFRVLPQPINKQAIFMQSIIIHPRFLFPSLCCSASFSLLATAIYGHSGLCNSGRKKQRINHEDTRGGQKDSLSRYDKDVLNYVKICLSWNAYSSFIAIPLFPLNSNDVCGQIYYSPFGGPESIPVVYTLWLWHAFSFYCVPEFCSRTMANTGRGWCDIQYIQLRAFHPFASCLWCRQGYLCPDFLSVVVTPCLSCLGQLAGRLLCAF